jgi:acetyl-CoA C-acetyltransferase
MRVGLLGMARTPFGRFGGALRSVTLPQLGTIAVEAAIRDAAISADDIDDVVLGINFPGSARSIARQVALRSGIPADRSATSVDRACCSALAAIRVASSALRLGETGVAVAGGVENLSRTPFFLEDLRFGHRLGDVTLTDHLVISCPHTGVPRAVQASDEAQVFGIGRREQDAWALRSQQRYAAARAAGFFDRELAPVDLEVDGRPVTLAEDECPRPGTSLEALSRLRTVYGSGTVTAGNAPDLSTGATAVVLASEDWLDRHPDVPPLAWFSGWTAVSGEPQKIASMPAVAAQLALRRAEVSLEDIDAIEINEAFAAVPLVTSLVLADGDRATAEKLRERTNINGGSIAIGHPTGATAARLVMTIVSQLRLGGGGTGLVTICGGIGEAEAVVVAVPAPA